MTLDEIQSVVESYEPRELIGYNYQKNYDIIHCEWWLPMEMSGLEIRDILDDIADETNTYIYEFRLPTRDPNVQQVKFDVMFEL